jgi:hypothetical protein
MSGNADGAGKNGIGGGVYNPRSSPRITKSILIRNAATAGGAGIYNGGAPEVFADIQILANFTRNGAGAGMFNQDANGFILNRVIFDGNVAKGSPALAEGGGIYNRKSDVHIFNSIFVGNSAQGKGGAIRNIGSTLEASHVTITANTAGAHGGVSNETSTATLVNSVSWQNAVGELSGTGITANHSLVGGGFPGTGNISSDPLFLDPSNPAGSDGGFFSIDDGLQLSVGSPAIDGGTVLASAEAQTDFLQTERPIDGDDENGSEPDMGAYEFLNIKEIEANLVGHYNEVSGVFKVSPTLTIIDDVADPSEFNWLAKSSAAYTIQATIKKNKHIKDSFFGRLKAFNNGTQVSPGFQVTFYRVGENGNNVTFSTQRLRGDGTFNGRPLILVTDPAFEKGTDSRAYILQSSPGSVLRFVVPHSQFR